MLKRGDIMSEEFVEIELEKDIYLKILHIAKTNGLSFEKQIEKIIIENFDKTYKNPGCDYK